MLGWLLIAAFFASLLAVALNAARPEKPRRPRPTRRQASPPKRMAIPDSLNLDRRAYADVAIIAARSEWMTDDLDVEQLEVRIDAALRHLHADKEYGVVRRIERLELQRARWAAHKHEFRNRFESADGRQVIEFCDCGAKQRVGAS